MDSDLRRGLVGHLDQLVPEVMADDIYGRDRRTGVPNAQTGEDVEVSQLRWWNSETQSNWWDGFIRHAVLTENPAALERCSRYIAEKLATQDADGYLGIYDSATRYRHREENGELWAQVTLLRGLLAWYEATREADVLQSVQRAIARTMAAFSPNGSHPFAVEPQFAGVNHGLMLVDVLDRLHHLTGDPAYLDYAVFLHREFNRQSMVEDDVQLGNLRDPLLVFKGHAVHTYEHLRALAIAAVSGQEPGLSASIADYVTKLASVLSPSGGPVGDEWIQGRTADAETIGYEYCSIHELLDSYGVLLQKTGAGVWADAMEWLVFNAGQGARHPEEHSIAYCKSDNSYRMQGSIDGKVRIKSGRPDTRYKYSPCHADVAVCCAPNAGRLYPYYVRAMWLRRPRGLAVALYGAGVLDSVVTGRRVLIHQHTEYPFGFTVALHLTLDANCRFEIALRRPAWAAEMLVDGQALPVDEHGFVVLEREWRDGDVIQVRFQTAPRVHEDRHGRRFVSYGPLVYALPLSGRPIPGRDYGLDGFRDLEIEPTEETQGDLRWDGDPLCEIVDVGVDVPLWRRFRLKTQLRDSRGEPCDVLLVPMGATVLRRVCFATKHPPSA